MTSRNSFSILFKEEVVSKMTYVSWFDICLLVEIDYHSHCLWSYKLILIKLELFRYSFDNHLFSSIQSISLGKIFNFLFIVQPCHGILIAFFINSNRS